MEALWFVFGALGTLSVIVVVVGIADYHELKDKVRNVRDEIEKQGEAIAHHDAKIQDLMIQIEMIQSAEAEKKEE